MKLKYKIKTATKIDILNHFNKCDEDFILELSKRVNLENFADKIFNLCVTFEAWDDGNLVGMVSAYFNDTKEYISFINHVSVAQDYIKNGIAKKILSMCLHHAKENSFKEVQLEVSKENIKALILYKKLDFIIYIEKNNTIYMKYTL